ncbi:MAG: PLP-dependent aminotransferase family protein [archaeon GB-1867-005]|nr:PLP-dependent aminotransferase family protein [Candidatus Culexmicrobium cathedralense]
MIYEKLWSEKTKHMKASEIRELLRWVVKGDVISFGGGMPDPKMFPKEDLAEIAQYVIREKSNTALQYGPTQGISELINELIKFMNKEGLKIDGPESIIITTGSQQVLDILGRILVDPGDVVIVELPTYLAAINALKVYEPKLVGIPLDDEGMKTDVLEEKVKELKKEGKRIKFIYTIPTCQNPTGLSMSMDRRKHLLEIASKYDLLIVEDDPYSYFLYEPVEFKHLKAMDTDDRVVYMSTFSKILSPGLRLGWMAGNPEFIRKIAIAKQSMDLCTSPLTQYIAAEALKRGVIEKHIPKIKEVYRKKRDAMLNALEKYMPKGSKWVKPVGGMFIFAWAPKPINTKQMLIKCVKEYGVAYVPGQAFHVDGSGKNSMRLNFTYPTIEQIEVGIKRISKAISEEMEKF